MNAQQTVQIAPDVRAKYETLVNNLAREDKILVAYSGGIDSTLALKAALDARGRANVLAITAVSAAVPEHERKEAAAIAQELNARHRFVDSAEIERPGYVANGFDRCYHCKSELYEILAQVAKAEGQPPPTVINGANADDPGDHRPGMQAASNANVRSPLIEAQMNKADVRAAARWLNVRIWDKPASPCLSSRIPYNSPVTVEKLKRIEAAEEFLRKHGFREFRVRHEEKTARIEIPAEDMPRLLEDGLRTEIHKRFRELGFLYVSLDLGGFKSGSLNRVMGE